MSLDKPAIGVGVVVFWEQHVLLIQRARPPKAGSWSIPGGKQELGETLRAAAIREVMEETGLALKEHDLRLLDAVDLIELPHFHYSLID
ncbi:MAG: NUDIX domain-containing protein, partial [Alphaproteobacteria bacterium]|nr:NUDIX domain-containing protein [Alphaproteobacteria bacterium]